MRRGVTLLVIGSLVAACAAAAARADTGSASTTTAATTTTAGPSYAPLGTSSLPARCVGAGVALIAPPSGSPLAIGTPASSLGASAYRAVLSFDSSSASGSSCTAREVVLNGVSLFGGAVTATTVEGKDGNGAVSGLAIDGSAASVVNGGSAAVGSWGILTLGKTVGRATAPLALRLLRSRDSLPAGTTILLAYAATAQPVAAKKPAAKPTSKPATSTTAPAAEQTHSAHAAHRARKAHTKKSTVAQPLKWTPHLGLKASDYVFPIDGGASYVDTYGAGRNDIYDGWHHGDDLFAPLGTPVVAVANGKLSLVGWNALGGWRIWLTDAKGNSFYYAHLSGYSRWILTHRNVKAGQVIGFLGRTGDAFTTEPHVHFEVHPHQLLKLGYDGAVDPTSYLESWRVEKVPASEIPQPARLRAPRGTPAQEAAVVWKQLLSARHLMPNGAPVVAFAAAVRRPYPGPAAFVTSSGESARRIAAVRTAEHLASPAGNDGPWPLVVLGITLAISAFGALFSVRRRRHGRAATG